MCSGHKQPVTTVSPSVRRSRTGACSSYSNHCCGRTGGEAAVSELGRGGGDSERLRRVGKSVASRAGLVLGLGLEPLELSRRCDSGDAIRLA